jgi:hypothetical protein
MGPGGFLVAGRGNELHTQMEWSGMYMYMFRNTQRPEGVCLEEEVIQTLHHLLPCGL